MSATLPVLPALPLPLRLGRLILTLLLTVVLFDACFWQVQAMGLSIAIFFALLNAGILANRPWPGTRRWRILLGLLAGAVLAAVIETGATNLLVLLALTVTLAGETFFVEVASSWGRGLSQVFALIFAPGRPFWLAARLLEVARGKPGWLGESSAAALLLLPVILLVVFFGWLLASGNAVFSHWTGWFFPAFGTSWRFTSMPRASFSGPWRCWPFYRCFVREKFPPSGGAGRSSCRAGQR